MTNEQLKLREGLQIRVIGEEALLYDQERKKVHLLNGSAAEIFSILKEGKDLDAVITHLKNKYNVDQNIIIGDVNTIISNFKELQFFCA